MSEDEQDCWTVRRTSVMELSRNGNLRKAQGYLRMTISKVISARQITVKYTRSISSTRISKAAL